MRSLSIVVGLVVFSLMAGCGGQDEKAKSRKETTATTPGATATATDTASPEPTEEPTSVEGELGDTFTLPDEYESNGEPADDVLEMKVSDFSYRQPTDPYGVYRPEKGYRWARLKIQITQQGATKTEPQIEGFVAVDEDGQTFEGYSSHPFKPSINPSSQHHQTGSGSHPSRVPRLPGAVEGEDHRDPVHRCWIRAAAGLRRVAGALEAPACAFA